MKSIFTILVALLFFQTSCLASQQRLNIIPQPQSVVLNGGQWQLQSETVIYASDKSKAEAQVFKAFIEDTFDKTLPLELSGTGSENRVLFIEDLSFEEESYSLHVNPHGIEIRASGGAGWFYGVQSLIQMIKNTHSTTNTLPHSLPSVTITDSPRFTWRAFMLDEARHFFGVNEVKKLLDEMARLKMNRFHWHLVDDQGWRIEIKKYPKLTEVGAKRESTQVGEKKWNSPKQSGEVHQGFYTQEQIKTIVEYALERHITIVPEIEMPGHSSAAIAAYSWLGTSKKEIEVPTMFGVSKDVYDVSDPKVVGFLKDVLDEVMLLFPSEVIHIGGDEVKYDQWKNSDQVASYMRQRDLKTPAELQVYFTNMISQYLKSKGRRMMGWNEILGHNVHDYQSEVDTQSKQQLALETVVHFWKGDLALATKAAQEGFDIVNSIHTNTYLDYDYKTTPLSKSYHFDPVPEGLAKEYHHKIIGSGCQMWTEWTPTRGELEYMTFPRIAAYAEVNWTNLSEKNFDDFKLRLKWLKKTWAENGLYFAEHED